MMRHNKKGGSDCEALAVFSIYVYHAREGDSGAFLAFGELFGRSRHYGANMGLLARRGASLASRASVAPLQTCKRGIARVKPRKQCGSRVKSVSPRLVGKRPKPFDLLRRASPLRCSIGEGTRGGSPARMVDSRALCSPSGNVYFPECSLCNFSGRLFIICGKYTPFIRALCTLYECRLYKR